MKAVFVHKPNSQYDDIKGVRYHFPKLYFSRVNQVVGDWFVYYEQLGRKGQLFYTGCGKIRVVVPDLNLSDHYYGEVEEYIDFDRPLYYREQNGFEIKLVSEDGRSTVELRKVPCV